MIPLAQRARGMQPSLLRRVLDHAPPGAINLALGQPDLPIPTGLLDSARAHLHEGGYSPNAGIPELRSAIAAQWDCESKHVIVTVGSAESLAVWALAGVEQGAVLVPDPGYPAYAALLTLLDVQVRPYPLHPERRWQPDPQALAQQMEAEDVVGLIINSPSNPCAVVHPPEVFAPALEIARKRALPVLSDEVYTLFSPQSPPASPVQGFGDVATRVGSISKSHGAMGWRVGWMVVPEGWSTAATSVHQFLTTCAPVPFQRAAVAALGGSGDAERAEYLQTLADRRARVLEHLSQWGGLSLPVEPQLSFYLFLDARERCTDDAEFCRNLAVEHGVVLAPGSGFGPRGANYLRLSYAVADHQLDLALSRLDVAFQ